MVFMIVASLGGDVLVMVKIMAKVISKYIMG